MTRVPVARLKKHSSPLNRNDGFPWNGSKVTRGDVTRAIKQGRLEVNYGTENHAERVAYLVVNKDDKPIEIDVGIPCLSYHPEWFVLDGNHRLAAAIYRKDEFIDADIAGQVDYAEHLFGITMEETK